MNTSRRLLKKYKVILPDRLSQVLIDGVKREEPTISSVMIRFPGNALYVDTIAELTEKIKSKCEMFNPANGCIDPELFGPKVTKTGITYRTKCKIDDFVLNKELMPAYTLEYEICIKEIYSIVHDFNDIPKK